MDLWATKDRHERETEETERLVRPAPKVKPPRKDLRRERTETDRDPDIDEDPDIARDKDLSLNYKSIGGSVVARVVARFLYGHDLTSLRVAARHVQADLDRGDYVAVVNKQTGETTHVKKETLKGPEGSKYKVVKEEEAEGEDQGEAKKKGPSEEDVAAVRDLATKEPRLKGVMDTLGDPKHKEHTTLTSLPDLPLGSILKGVKFPEGVKTLGDLQSIVESAPKPGKKEKAPKKALPPKEAPVAEAPKKEPPKEESVAEAPKKEPPKEEPAPEAKKEPPKEEPPKDEAAPEAKKEPPKKEEAEPGDIKAPVGAPPGALPPSEEKTEAERDEAAEAVQKFVDEKVHESPDFKAWTKKSPTISEGEDGGALFLVPGTKQRVPFEQLPEEEQSRVVEKFNADHATEKSADDLKQLAAKNPQLKKMLRELANPNSELRAKIEKLETEAKSQGLDLSSYDVKKSIGGLEGVKLPPHLQGDLEHFVAAADKAYAPPPEPERPKSNKQEEDRAEASLTETLPPEFADHVASMGLHPDQVSHLLSGYRAAMRAKVPDDHVLSAAGFQLDPEHIEPPEFVHHEGKKIAFEDLSPKDQSDAFDQYKMHVLATSMAAKQRLENQFADTGLPAGPAKVIAETALKFKGKDLDDGTVQKFFSTSLATSFADKPLDEGDIKHLMDRVKDNPAAKKLVAAYVQANSYAQAREQFLDSTAPKGTRITEWDDPEKLAKKVEKASEFIAKMTKHLPHDSLVVDPGMAFRNRIMDRMGALAPEKVPYIRSYLKDYEMKDYETRQAQAEKLQKTFDAALKKERETREKERAKAPKDPYREAPEPEEGSEEDTRDLLDRLAQKGIVKPKAPVQPPEYQDWKDQKHVEESAKASYSWLQNVLRGRAEKKQRKREESEDIEKKRKEREESGEGEQGEDGPPVFEPELGKTASLTVEERVLLRTLIPSLRQRVAFRAEMGLLSSYSSYPGCWTMGDSSPGVRTAVYWGQEPYEQTEAYPGWSQVHARDFGDADFDGILKAAREWLKLPVLSREIKGLYPDTQFRAALDLAIRDHENGKYSVGLYPTVYNELLARLSGRPGPYELLTGKPDDVPVAGVKNAGKSTYGATTERGSTMKASAQVRLFASRAASGTPDPELAFDLAALADRLAADEAQAGSAAQAGQEQAGQQQAPAEAEAQKQAAIRVAATQITKFNAVKALVVKQATAYPTLREVFLPILQALKG